MTEEAATLAFLRSLRIAATAIAAAVLLGLDLLHIVPHLHQFRPPAIQVAGYLVFVAITAINAILVIRNLAWGRWCWPTVTLVLVADVAMCLSLPLDTPLDNGETALGTVGWLGVLLLFEQPLWTLLIFIGAHALISNVMFLNSDSVDKQTLLALGVVTVGICSLSN